jgi:hypothetical protein
MNSKPTTGKLSPFTTVYALFEYLCATHPPQNPGFMPDDDHWAPAVFLLDQNGRLPA